MRGTYTGFDRMPIAGEWRAGSSGATATDSNPFSGEVLCEIPMANADDLDRAYRAAREAQREWAAALPSQRAAVLLTAAQIVEDRRDEIADWLVREAGAARTRAGWEVEIVREGMLAAAGYPARVAGRILPAEVPGKENRVYRRPVGVVGVISPWNFPLHLSNRSVAPALAVGNGVVLKPASDTPVTGGLLLAKVYEEAGLPAGLLSVVIGKGSEVGDAFVEHPIPRVISFTGSTPVGVGIAAKAGIKKLALELGGNGPLVVLDDADLDVAIDAAIFGRYFHQGQICMATNRIIVDATVHDRFVDGFLTRARQLQVGDPDDAKTQIGPVINESQLGSIRDKVTRAVDDGAQLLLAGDPSGPTGQVLPPHVLTGGNGVATAAEEVFGPVATIIRADDEHEALRLANDTSYGLSSAVFTSDVEHGMEFALGVEAGMTHVNDTTVNDELNTAFGGEKDSGLGRFGGDWALEEFTTEHWISVQHRARSYAF